MMDTRATTGSLVILGASERAARLAEKLPCAVVHLVRPGGDVGMLARGDASYYSVDYTDHGFAEFVEAVLRPLQPRAVVSLAETGVLPAALANDTLGLPGTPPEVVRTLNDKARTRELLAARGVHDLSVRYLEPRDGEHAAQVMASWGESARAILKPRCGSGSRRITLVTRPDQLGHRGDLTWALMEEYVPGQEYSAETFSGDGEHRVIAVTEKYIDPSTFVELGHVIPAPSLPGCSLPGIEAAISRFLDAIGLRDGPAHTEFKILDGEVKIIESHSRPGGDGITMLAQLVTGFDLIDWGLRWPLGHRPLPAPAPPTAPAAAVAFATAAPGEVTEVTLPTRTPAHIALHDIGAFVHAGDVVRELGSSDDRVGCAMTVGPDPLSALAAAREMAGAIKVTTKRAG